MCEFKIFYVNLGIGIALASKVPGKILNDSFVPTTFKNLMWIYFSEPPILVLGICAGTVLMYFN